MNNNTVAVLQDRAAKALDYAQESVKQLLTLSTGVVALTLTFFKDFAGATSASARDAMFISWILFFASIVFGMLSLLSMTSNIWPKKAADRSKPPPDIWTTDLRTFAVLQVISFGAAFIAMVVAGTLALGSHASTPPSPTPTAPPSPTPTAPPSPTTTAPPSPTPATPTDGRALQAGRWTPVARV